MKYLIAFILVVVVSLSFGQSAQTITFSPNVSGSGSNGTAPDTSGAFQIIDWKNYYLGGLLLPQSFADSLTFLVSNDGTNYFKLQHPSADSIKVYVVEVDSLYDGAISLDEQALKPWDFIKLITDVGVGSVASDTTITASLTRRGSESR